jgi:phosphatidylinositol glycan class O
MRQEFHPYFRAPIEPVEHVFLFVVDALRLDFMVVGAEPELAGRVESKTGTFRRMHSLMRKNKSQCLFFGFRADPPTVTAQRLKGITTGGMPAFVEIGTNFNAAQIVEDSIIGQLKHHNRR